MIKVKNILKFTKPRGSAFPGAHAFHPGKQILHHFLRAAIMEKLMAGVRICLLHDARIAAFLQPLHGTRPRLRRTDHRILFSRHEEEWQIRLTAEPAFFIISIIHEREQILISIERKGKGAERIGF